MWSESAWKKVHICMCHFVTATRRNGWRVQHTCTSLVTVCVCVWQVNQAGRCWLHDVSRQRDCAKADFTLNNIRDSSLLGHNILEQRLSLHDVIVYSYIFEPFQGNGYQVTFNVLRVYTFMKAFISTFSNAKTIKQPEMYTLDLMMFCLFS